MELETEIEELTLRPLTSADAETYLELLESNRDHLTAFGDFVEILAVTPEDVARELSTEQVGRFGVWFRGSLIGRVDLQPKGPGDAVLGYWLDTSHTGHGYATASCRAVIGHGRASMGVEVVYAGVTHGNAPSEALLRRLGFERVADMGPYTRFLLTYGAA